MKQLRRKFDRFCFRNRNKGIPNLMAYIAIGTAIVNLMNLIDPSYALYYLLRFDRSAILGGQIWRLITWPLTYSNSSLFMTMFALFCYWSFANGIEKVWGPLRFNLFYLSGVVLMDIYCMIFGGYATASYLNLSLVVSFATLFPDTHILIFFIIPVKAWALALFYLVTTLIGCIAPFPVCLYPLIAMGNYFLFFGTEVKRVIPISWQINASRAVKKAKNPRAKTIPFNSAGNYQATHATVRAPYTHKCTVCGRTDVDNPELEFRYCSRCKGYYCYCQEHISNHTHITE
ncbi:MAG: rhomboid family intramembrane serine protease [Ruminococcaceae bacterium]|nr:rhomboid family intramembrane serine protease [Oscillospiraceae bacterium]